MRTYRKEKQLGDASHQERCPQLSINATQKSSITGQKSLIKMSFGYMCCTVSPVTGKVHVSWPNSPALNKMFLLFIWFPSDSELPAVTEQEKKKKDLHISSVAQPLTSDPSLTKRNPPHHLPPPLHLGYAASAHHIHCQFNNSALSSDWLLWTTGVFWAPPPDRGIPEAL